MGGNKQSVAYASLILMIGTILAKIIGFARELIVAYRFGTGPLSDAFLLTNSIPSILFGALATVIGVSYIPYCQSMDKDKVDEFTSNILHIMFLIMVLGCVVVNLLPEVALKMFASGISGQSKEYAVLMLRIVVFSIIPITVSYLFQAYSQVKGLFHSTAWFGLVTNTIIIVFTVITTDETYYLLSVGVVVSNIIGMMLVVWGLRNTGYRYSPILKPFSPDIKAIVILTIPLLIENLAYNMSLLVDRNLASYLDTGTISGLSYAGTMGNIASSMVAGAIITAIFPTLSLFAARNEKTLLDNSMFEYARWILVFLAPISMFMVFCAKDIVAFIFEHGAFKSTSSEIVWQCMICYAVGVVPAGLQTYFIRVFYSLKDMKITVYIQVFSLFCNIVLNLVSVTWLKHIGIALSTSISYLIALILLTIVLLNKHGIKSVKKINVFALINCLGAILCGIVVYFLIKNVEVQSVATRLIIESVVFFMLYFIFVFLVEKEMAIKCYRVVNGKMKQIINKYE